MPRNPLAEQHVLAMLAHLRGRTVAIAVVNGQEQAIPIGSGTCVRIGRRFLVATAAHVVEGERLALGVAIERTRRPK
jgi:hypothetical protein